MADESLEFIGRTLLAIQDEMRGFRAEQQAMRVTIDSFRDEQHIMRGEIREFKAELRDFRAELREIRTVVLQTDDTIRRMRERVAALEAARS